MKIILLALYIQCVSIVAVTDLNPHRKGHIIRKFKHEYIQESYLASKLKANQFHDAMKIKQRYVSASSDCGLISYIQGVNSSCCQMSNVVCENGRIISLRFTQWKINTLEPISYLSELIHLELSFNNITSLEPVSRLKNLKQLLVDGNHIYGTMEPITNLSKLELIYLDYNYMYGTLSYLENLSSLTVVYLGANYFSGTLDSIAGLTNLLQFSVDFNLISGTMDSLKNLVNLTFLYVSHNQISGNLSAIANMTLITKLNVADNLLTGDLEFLSSMSMLDHFNAGYNYFGGNLHVFNKLAHITYVDLDNNHFNGTLDSFSSSVKMNYLFLDCNNLTGSMNSLSYLSNLIQLNLSVNSLEGEVKSIVNMTKLEKLSLFGNQFNGSIDMLNLFRNPESLHVLRIDDNYFSEIISVDLRPFTGLNEFNISKNLLHGVFKVIFPSQSIIIDARANNFDCPYPISPSQSVFLTSPCNTDWKYSLTLLGYFTAILFAGAIIRYFILFFCDVRKIERKIKNFILFIWVRLSIALNLIFYSNVFYYLSQDRSSCQNINYGGIFSSFLEFDYSLPTKIYPTTTFYNFMQACYASIGYANNAVITNLADFKNLCSIFPGCGFSRRENWFGCDLINESAVKNAGHEIFLWLVITSLAITIMITLCRSAIVMISLYIGYIPWERKLLDFISSDPFTLLFYFFQSSSWNAIMNYEVTYLDLSWRILFDCLLCNLPRWLIGLYYIQIVQTGYSFVDFVAILSGLVAMIYLIFQFLFAYFQAERLSENLDEYNNFKPELLEKLDNSEDSAIHSTIVLGGNFMQDTSFDDSESSSVCDINNIKEIAIDDKSSVCSEDYSE